MEYPFDIESDCGFFGVYRGWMSRDDADQLFTELKQTLNWQQPVVKMRGNVWRPERRICEVYDEGISPYRFPGSPEAREDWTPSLAMLLGDLRTLTGDERLNHALLNHYLTGASSLGYHSDSRRDLQPDTLIVGVVLGSGRDFLLKKIGTGTRAQKLFLDVGDVFVMDQGLQKHYQHSVPKRAKGRERISITYRATKVQSPRTT